jgi:MFS family permease
MLGFALFGGALADRLKKKRIIQACQGLGSVTALAVAIAISTGAVNWVHLLIASLINGFIFAFMVPARTALIPQLVSRENAANAYALSAAAMSTTTLLAPALAGNFYNWFGAAGVYYIISALQASAVFFTGLIDRDDRPKPAREKAIFKEIGIGLSYIKRNRLIIVLIVLSISTALLSMPFRSLLPVFIVDVFRKGPEALGMLVSIMGIGSIAGSIGVAAIGKWHRGAILLTGGLISAMSLIAVALYPAYGLVAFLMIFLGLGDAFRRSLTMALIMETTEQEYQGRVSSVYTMNFGLMPLGTLPASAIAHYFGVRAAVGSVGVLLLAVCLIVLLSQRQVRRLQ